MVSRIYVEKKPGFDVEASQLLHELQTILGVTALQGLRLINRYDVEGITDELFNQCVPVVFSEPQVDTSSEMCPEVEAVFTQELLPQFPARGKIRVVQADAFEYARALRGGEYDFAFADLWHDVADGLPMYRRMRGILRTKAALETAYWIEETMKWYE